MNDTIYDIYDNINKLRHWLFIIIYIITLFTTSIVILFPLFLIKCIGLYNTSRLIDIYTASIQHYSNFLVLWILGTKIYVYNDKNLPEKFKYNGPVLMIANHLCELDPIYFGVIIQNYFNVNLHLITFVKHTLRFYPFLNSILLANDAIFVQNKNKKQNKDQHKYIENKLEAKDHSMNGIIIFPEGTTYSESIKKYRESQALSRDTPTFNNLLIPKTNGLYLIQKYSGIKDAYHAAMKFVMRKEGDDPNLSGLLKGHTPKEVHIFLKRDDKKVDDDLLEIENKLLFDKSIYDDFKKMDESLDQNLNEWSEKYDKIELGCSWQSIIYFLVYNFISFFTVRGILSNPYIALCSLLVIGFWYIVAFFEFWHRDSKYHEKID